jgi:hypothetical protein
VIVVVRLYMQVVWKVFTRPKGTREVNNALHSSVKMEAACLYEMFIPSDVTGVS